MSKNDLKVMKGMLFIHPVLSYNDLIIYTDALINYLVEVKLYNKRLWNYWFAEKILSRFEKNLRHFWKYGRRSSAT